METRALILAGGIGKRFAPFATTKTLFPFMSKPLIWYVMKKVAEAKIAEVMVVTNAENHEVVEKIADELHLKITRFLQDEPLGMGHAVFSIREEIVKSPVIIMNGVDIVDEALLPNLIQETQKSERVLVGIKRDTYFPGGYFKFNDNKIVEVIEKPDPNKIPSNYVKLVFDYFKNPREIIDALEIVGYTEDDSYEKALSEILSKHNAAFVPYDGPWSKLKYPFHALDVTAQFLTENTSISSSASISPSARVVNSFIGDNVIIGDQVLIRDSIIENDSVIGFGTEVARSYVGPRTMTHHAYIGDSVLEGDTNVSYGTCLTNMRMDGKTIRMTLGEKKIETERAKCGAMIAKNVFLAANVTTMPGITIKIGEKIYPGVIVR